MKVQSTGLGKTVMVAELGDLQKADFDGESNLMVTMESTEPLHWTIKVYMRPKDVRRAVMLGLRPSIIWRVLMGMILGRFSFSGKRAAKSRTAGEAAPGSPGPAANQQGPTAQAPENASGGVGLLAKFKE